MNVKWADKETRRTGDGYKVTSFHGPKRVQFFKRLFWRVYIETDKFGRILWKAK